MTSYTLIEHQGLVLSVDENNNELTKFDLSLGTGFNHASFGTVNVEMNGLNLRDLVEFRNNLAEVIESIIEAKNNLNEDDD